MAFLRMADQRNQSPPAHRGRDARTGHLLSLARLCDQVGEARAGIQSEREECPVLWELVADLPRELYSLAARVTSKILPSGELDDRASPELARVRHDIVRLRSTITRSLENLMRRSDEAIQDALVTVRNERYVIPVRAATGPSSASTRSPRRPDRLRRAARTIDANNELQPCARRGARITRILSSHE